DITPATYFAGLNDELMRYAEVGREQLKLLAKTAELGIADSEYNRKELEEAGLTTTAVVPPLVDWEDFDRPPDQDVARRLADERTSILTVGQILAHTAVHDVIAAFARYRESDRTAHLYLVGPTAMSAGYLDRVRGNIRKLGLDGAVTLTGSVTVEQLVAYYRGATAFLTLSEHEGFCVPLLEAMRSDLPVVANAAAAIPETLGDGGILLENKSPEIVAAQLERVVRDQTLRKDLIEKGRRRVEAFSRGHIADRLKLALAQAAPGDPLHARARAREVPSLPPSLGRAPLQPALPVAARAPADSVGRPASGELVPAVPPDPDVHGRAPAQACGALDAERALV